MSNFINRFSALIATGLVSMLVSCFNNPERPSVTTMALTVASPTQGLSGIVINSDGGGDIIEKGICHSNLSPPTIRNERIIVSDKGNSFAVYVPLQQGSGRYYRAYAINGAGVSYGNEVAFASVITHIDSFGGGNKYSASVTGTTAIFTVTVKSDIEVLSKGICWNTLPDPTIATNKLESGTGPGTFTTTVTGLTLGTAYYVRPYATNRLGIFYGDPVSFKTKDFPKVNTKEFLNEGTFIVACGADVVDDGGFIEVTTGICWSTHPSPTLSDNQNDNKMGIIYYHEMRGLKPGVTYYVRAYASNGIGLSYGDERVITMPAADVYDMDGNPYSDVTIGTQTWLVENLKTTKYANGDVIPNITTLEQRINATSGGWCHWGNVVDYEHPFGKLYNWYAATDVRNVCPSGWHAPSEAEWTTLIDYLGGSSVAGDKLKEKEKAHWFTDYKGATNSSGFTALPGGGQGVDNNNLYFANQSAYFWSTTTYTAPYSSDNFAWSYTPNQNNAVMEKSIYSKQMGQTIRCIKD